MRIMTLFITGAVLNFSKSTFVKGVCKILCSWLLVGSPSPFYNDMECTEFSASRLEYCEPKGKVRERTGQRTPAWLRLGLLLFQKGQPLQCSFKRAADCILGAFIMPDGHLGKLMCPWGISTQQSLSSLALCFSPLAFSGYHRAFSVSGRWQVMSGRWPEGLDPYTDKE